MIDWFFGFPGSGKSHCADVYERMTGFPRYEGDDFQTPADKRKIKSGTFGLPERHAQLARISEELEGLTNAIVTHPLPDLGSRLQLRLSGTARLIYVKTPLELARQRVMERKGHEFTADLFDAWLLKHWLEPSEGECFVIENGLDAPFLEDQLRKLIERGNA